MKKILIISFHAYSLFDKKNQTTQGGSEIIAYQIANHLDKKSFEVHFITGDSLQIEEGIVNNVILHKGTSINNFGPTKGFINFLKLLTAIKKINPDIIFSSSAGWLTVEIIIIKIILRKKYVFRSSHKKNINGYADQRDYGWLYRKLINKIDHFILQNYEDIPVLCKNYNFIGRTTVIRNFQIIPEGIPPHYAERRLMLWVGRSEKIKNPELFLSLAKKLPEHKFVMIMPNTNSEIFNKIVKLAKNEKNLEIISGVARDKIMDYYRKSKYLVSTSEAEGFPNVLVEAMKFGTPVISFFLDYDNILKKNKCGFVGNKNDINDVIEFIKNTNEEKWKVFSNNCYNFAKENFDIKKGIKKYEEIFLQL